MWFFFFFSFFGFGRCLFFFLFFFFHFCPPPGPAFRCDPPIRGIAVIRDMIVFSPLVPYVMALLVFAPLWLLSPKFPFGSLSPSLG